MGLVKPFAFMGSAPAGSTPDADAWIAQVISDGGSLTTTEQNAVKDLETDLRDITSGSDSLYDRLYAIYPIVGGDEASSKYNLKGAASSFTYTINYQGSWTFDGNGATGDGTSTYGDTLLSPAGVVTLNGSSGYAGISVGIYLTVNVQTPSGYDLGANEQSVIAGFGNTTLYANFKSSPGSYRTATGVVTGTGDLYYATHTVDGTGTTTGVKNATDEVIAGSSTFSTTESNTFYLGNDHRGGSNPEYGNKGYGFAFIGAYIPGDYRTSFNNAVQDYNTALSR